MNRSARIEVVVLMCRVACEGLFLVTLRRWMCGGVADGGGVGSREKSLWWWWMDWQGCGDGGGGDERNGVWRTVCSYPEEVMVMGARKAGGGG